MCLEVEEEACDVEGGMVALLGVELGSVSEEDKHEGPSEEKVAESDDTQHADHLCSSM